MDDLPIATTASLSKANQECEEHFKSTHSRNIDGHYNVRTPVNKSLSQLEDSKSVAVRRLSRLMNKLESNPKLHASYSDFLNEYETCKHMKLLPTSSTQKPVYYLPHHGVLRENSTTTKLRVVFNASSRSSTGVSLNDIVHKGQKLQTELIDVLIWFRQFRFEFTADIEKMYHQIDVNPLDWDMQRILWSKKPNEILTYQLTTVTWNRLCSISCSSHRATVN